MADNDVRLGVGVETDKRSIDNAIRSFDNLEKSVVSSARGIGDSNRETVRATRATQAFADSNIESTRKVDQLTDAIQRQRAELDRRNQEFDRVSRDVGLAGDVQSNLGAVSGLAGAAGAGGVASGIGIAGELVVLVEELPRLKAAVQGIPAAANQAGKALGLGGAGGLVGALGLTAAAVVAVKLAFDEFVEAAQAQAQQLKNVFTAQADVNRQIAQGLTETAARQQIGTNERLIELEKQRLSDLEAAYQSFENQTNAALEGFAKIFSPQEQALADEIKNTRDSLDALQQSNNALQSAIETGKTSTDQATQAEQSLSQARETSSEASEQSARRETKNVERERERTQAIQQQTQSSNSAAQAQEKLNNLQRDYASSVAKVRRATTDEFADLAVDIRTTLADGRQDIARDLQRSNREGVRNLDVLGLFEANEQAEQARQDLITQTERTERDRLREITTGQQRELRELRIAQNERLRIERNAWQQSARLTQQGIDRVTSIIVNGINSAGMQLQNSNRPSGSNPDPRVANERRTISSIIGVMQS